MSSYKAGASMLGASPIDKPVLGSSPPSSQLKDDKGAKRMFNRLKFDDALEPTEFTVGYVESEQQPERKSGVEAWSMRVHDHLVEISFSEFMAKFAEDKVPFHRIAYFKQHGVRVWESEYHRKRLGLGGGCSTPPPHERLLQTENSAGAFPGDRGSYTAGKRPPQHPFSSSLPRDSNMLAMGQHSIGTPPSGLAHRASRDREYDAYNNAGSYSVGNGRKSAPLQGMRASRSSGYIAGESSGGGGLFGGSDDEENVDDNNHNNGHDNDDDPFLLLGQQSDEDGSVADSSEDEDSADQPNQPDEIKDLPEECWMKILEQLHVRELCMMARVNKYLRQLCGAASVWQHCHATMFGCQPPEDWTAATTRRMCRRSQLKAARWIEAQPNMRLLGSVGTRCLAVDDTKVVSGDGAALRVWSHVTGRRIATLQGHAGRVTCVTFDEEHVVSGCSQSVVKVWGMDDLKCTKTLRGHEGPITGVALLAGGIPASCSEDGSIQVWDMASSQPILRLATGQNLTAMQVQQSSGYVVVAGERIQIWDVSTAQLLHTLTADGGQHPLATSASNAANGNGNAIGNDQEHHAGFDGDFEEAPEDLMIGWGADNAGMFAAGPPFTSVAYNGHLLAGSRQSGVVLWDVRTQQQIGSLGSSTWSNIKIPVTSDHIGIQDPVLAGGAIARMARQRHGNVSEALSSSPLLDSLGILGSSPASRQAFGSVASTSPAMNTYLSQDGLHGNDGMAPSCFASAGIAAAAAGNVIPGAPNWNCTAVQLDDWKLAVSLADSEANRGMLAVHDIRAASCSSNANSCPVGTVASWQEPVMVLHSPARVLCFQFINQLLLAGLEGQECGVWSMDPPNQNPSNNPSYGGGVSLGETSTRTSRSNTPGPSHSNAGGWKQQGKRSDNRGKDGSGAGGDENGSGRSPPGQGWAAEDDEASDRGGRGNRKKPAKQVKKQTRYPKRNGK